MNYNEFLIEVKAKRMNYEFNSYPFYTDDKNVKIFSYEINKDKSKPGLLNLKKLNTLYTYNIESGEYTFEKIESDKTDLNLNVKMLSLTELKELKNKYNEALNNVIGNEISYEKYLDVYSDAFKKLINDDFIDIYKLFNCYIKEDE